ncbi:hypothetical protein COV19_05135 [Candidatus Woesearchaeota archaeon CG10_big_fil_rev_8_21_14_0_10_44_13]|nr:MAG: hypothetical protein COV19_05135 [Candidatus Woesearchaeota archaeon CG10_big_fil_rev_8_21_14_0_10_44_13]
MDPKNPRAGEQSTRSMFCILLLYFLTISLISLILIPHICLAQEEEESNEDKIFDGWVTEGESFQVSGLDVYVSSGDVGGDGILSFPQKLLVIKSGNCAMVDRLNVCITEWEYLRGGSVKIHGDDKQKYHIIVTIPAPKLFISRSAENSDLEVGETTRVTGIIRNDGTEPALGIVYTETVPSQFEVSITNNIDQRGNRLVWTGSLPPGEEKKFAYNLMARSTFEGDIPAKIQYKVHNVAKEFTDDMHIEARPLINIGQKRDKRDLQYGDEDRFYITLENKRSEDADVELTVNVPKAFYVVATHINGTASSNILTWKGAIAGGQSQEFITRVRADDAGIFNINITVHGIFKDSKTAEAYEQISMNVSIKDAELYFIPKKVKLGEESTVKVYLKNPNTYAALSDMDISASSDYFNGTIHLDKFNPLQYNDVLAFNMKPEAQGKFKCTAEITYKAGSRRFTAKKVESLEITEEKAVEEEPPVQNETQVQNETAAGGDQGKGSFLATFSGKELFAVRYSSEKIGSIEENIMKVFDFRKAISEAIAKKNSNN